MKKSLSGKWLFKSSNTDEWLTGQVPGCNFLDLMSNGKIDDPFVGLNEKDVQWVGECDFDYKRSFTITRDELQSRDILLNADMLDTICDVFINERLLFKGNNCFTPYSVSAKSYLIEGENEIRIHFYSPVNYVKSKYKDCATPVNSNGLNGIVHIRKPQCHFGWDWGPVLPSSGITEEIYFEFVNDGKINDFCVTQKILPNGAAVISAKAQVELYNGAVCEISLTEPNGNVTSENEEHFEFIIQSPELWWTKELSGKKKQPLYTVTAKIKSNGKVIDEVKKKIGIRTIELNRQRDTYGRNFQFILNGVPLFIKGASYIPPDSFITRFDSEKLNELLDAAEFSNMNMLRIWGGGYYGSDALYNACDERGILLWQDFCFACQAYPFFDDDFLDNVKREVASNVKRLMHHPSLAIWCGNNEIEDMSMAWAYMTKYVKWTEKFFYTILEKEIQQYDKETPYTQGSPIGEGHGNGVEADNVGDTHLWAVWHGLKPMTYYRKRMTRFCSEFGFESLPDIKAIKQFAQNKDCRLDSEVMTSHQKCANGNDKMIYYISSRFNLPKKFEDCIYLSQAAQLECIADATEHWRRNKGRCNGSMYWQFNDCWGVCSWSSIDYYGNYKALQYGAAKFNAPLSISAQDDKDEIKIFVLNDLNEGQNVSAEYEIFDFTEGTLEKKSETLSVNPLENRQVFTLKTDDIQSKYDTKKTAIAIRLFKDEKELMQKVILFHPERKLSLPNAHISTKVYIEKGRLMLNIQSDNFARLVKIESRISSLPFSDNYFDILPNGHKDVFLYAKGNEDLKELAQNIKVTSLSDVEFDKSPLKIASKKLKVYASPINIANAMSHGKIPPNVKF